MTGSILNYHPFVSAFYLCSVIIITMFSTNPILLLIALFGGVSSFFMLKKPCNLIKELAFYFMLFLVVSLSNPLFSHNGATTLFFINDNRITLEALLYGFNLAIMLIAVIFWFKCFNIIITQDKLIYLFGKLSPKIALLISSALRFIPLFKEQSEKIRNTQKAMGLFATNTITDKLKGSIRVFSSLVTWAFENAIDTASSMNGRGYGLKKRSYYSLYRFKISDALMLLLITILDLIIILITAKGKLQFEFYPQVTALKLDFYSVTAIIIFILLAFLPFVLEVKEVLFWKYYKSKI